MLFRLEMGADSDKLLMSRMGFSSTADIKNGQLTWAKDKLVSGTIKRDTHQNKRQLSNTGRSPSEIIAEGSVQQHIAITKMISGALLFTQCWLRLALRAQAVAEFHQRWRRNRRIKKRQNNSTVGPFIRTWTNFWVTSYLLSPLSLLSMLLCLIQSRVSAEPISRVDPTTKHNNKSPSSQNLHLPSSRI